ncbi:ferric reductase [bacterium]|nr:ferric reductase [bacterium]NBX97854.1 ferric reductase [bacterium]NDC94293.1 ferric reductase [bacterium]NDD84325.1 ferric reductase [bacterium]NDG28698.1 ferric reductase [bacterium]
MSKKDFKQWIESYGGWMLIGLFCTIPVIRWVMLQDVSYLFANPNSFFSSFGKLTGLVGLVLYAINLLLAARTRWMENLFNGLNKVYIAHHLTGGIALILLVFHPLFLAVKFIDYKILSSFKDAATFLLPRAFTSDTVFYQLQQSLAINAGIVAFIGMVVLLVLTFFVKLPYRIWLATHKFLGVAFMFAGLHVVLISSDTSRDNFLKFYMLAWVIIGLSAFVYRTLMSNVFVRRYTYKVIAVTHQNGNVVGVTMEPLEKKMTYKAGQFVFIRFLWSEQEGIIREAHPFSIASSPGEANVRLYIKSLGDYTTSLKNLKVGTLAEIEGAYGKFTFTRFGIAPQVWIAGGIGITPFLSMARSYMPDSPQVDLVYSVVNRTELLDQKAVAEFLPSTYKSFRYFSYIAKEQDGFLTAQKVSDMCGGLNGKEIFICGPPLMMSSLRSQLRQLGVPNRRIHSEEFSMQ